MKLNNLILSLGMVLIVTACNTTSKEEKASTKVTPTETATTTAPQPGLANKVADVFEEKFGKHEGKRRNHIDGFCFSGHFTLNDQQVANYTNSKIFSKEPLSVMGRFSHKGGVKKDESAPGEYGMAFEVSLESGAFHNFSMNTLDFFPVKTPEGFFQLMQAKVSGKAEDFDQLKKDHPEFKNYKTHYGKKKSELRSYANHQFNSVNSFYFENEKGVRSAVRWSFVPRNEMVSLETAKEVDLFYELEKALKKHKELKWDMVVYLANPGDDIEDASKAWEGEHKQFVAATLTIDGISKEGACQPKNFDPLQMLAGVSPSNDPILKFRSPAYAASFVRRLQEANRQSSAESRD